MTHLLDVNLLLALFDPLHRQHQKAHQWFSGRGSTNRATCPLTENGLVRIASSPAYALTISPAQAQERLRKRCADAAHEFWADDLSIADESLFDFSKLTGHRQITDAYLAGLALHHGGKLATFDKNIPIAAVVGASASTVELIATS